MMLLVVPLTLDILIGIFGFLSLGVFVSILYYLIIGPTLKALRERQSQPPEVGYSMDVVLDHNVRSRIVRIGLTDGDIKLRLQGIKEDHMTLKFHREAGMEEYDITLQPGGHVFFRPPHARKLERVGSAEKMESSELIGHPATFRLAAVVQHDRPLQYAEFELSTSYFINRVDEEKMKFTLTLKKLFPGVDRNRPVKKGIYRFARQQAEEEAAEEGEESENKE